MSRLLVLGSLKGARLHLVVPVGSVYDPRVREMLDLQPTGMVKFEEGSLLAGRQTLTAVLKTEHSIRRRR